MRIKHIVLAIAVLLLTTGCYEEITGTVVDAETGKPIEGAVVYVEWRKTKGLGFKYGETYKVIEVVTDKEGKFTVSGVLDPFVRPPIIVVYKKDYVAWRNDFIFPDYEKRKDFQWQNDYVFRLERFKKTYSHSLHIFFFQSDLSLTSSSKLYQAYSWENPLASKEEELLRKKRQTKKPNEYTEKEIWGEIVEELYLQKEKGRSE